MRARAIAARPGFPPRAVDLAAIDLGSNAARLLVARLHPDGHLERTEWIRQPVRLGADAFAPEATLSEKAIARALDAFHLFRRVLDWHNVSLASGVRACATSATRDARNRDLFIERVLRETGIRIDVISGVEEADLIRLAVGARIPLAGRRAALVDVGGGSTEVSYIEGEQILFSESFNVGTVRMLEEFAVRGAKRSSARLMEEYIDTLEPLLREKFGDRTVDLCVATGGNIEALARLDGKHAGKPGTPGAVVPVLEDEVPPSEEGGAPVRTLPLARLKAIRKQLEPLGVKDRMKRFGLRRDRADVIVPAAHIYYKVAKILDVDTLHLPYVGLVDGILEALRRKQQPQGADDPRPSQVRVSALVQGRRLHLDEPHALKTAEMALVLFDATIDLHGLGRDDRVLLEAAAILHDIGAFIEPRRHHKHSLYLIANLEIVGLSPRERLLVANIARYHRKSLPSLRHDHYRMLGEEERSRVRKLTALLRIADALDREHAGQVHGLTVQKRSGVVWLRVAASGDLLLESWALDRRADLFREVYGWEVRLKIVQEPARPARHGVDRRASHRARRPPATQRAARSSRPKARSTPRARRGR